MTLRHAPASSLDATGEANPPKRHSSTLTAALRTLRTWMSRSRQRRALRELAQEEQLLNDIGLSREQALREGAKPFWRR